MRHAWLSIGSLVLVAGTSAADPALEPDQLPVPPLPIVASKRKVELPAVPVFALAPGEPGLHDVKELRVRGHRFVGTELTVTGHITGIYDCIKALAQPPLSAAQIQQMIDDNPSLCERQKFYLGPTASAAPALSLWVVDAPRPPNKRERAAMSRGQLHARAEVPDLAVGDFVAVTGAFALSSPAGEHNSEGLLVYRSLRHVPPGALAASVVLPAAPPEPPPVTIAPLRAVVPRATREASIEHYELCNLAIKSKQLDAALAECRVAVEGWAGNHLAWYALGNIHALREDWAAAAGAYDHAARLRPDSAMYQTYDGVALYEAATRARERPDRDRRAALRELRDDGTGVLRVHRVARALSSLEPFASASVERARHALAAAVKLAPMLPLAHYYLGRIYRDQDYPAEAARELSAAIQQDPSLPEPYISLVELYRVWAFVPQGLAVARVGAVNVGGGPAADVWYELGMAQQAAGQDADAISAFTRTLAIRPGHAQAKFQRGQLYLRTGELANAGRDLEEFIAAAGPALAFPKEIATSLLSDLRRKLVTQKDPTPN